MYTEDQAAIKMCPFFKELCYQSQCMAWRWHRWRTTFNYTFPSTADQPNAEADKLEKEGWDFVGIEGGMGALAIWERKSERGYCGLAGKP